MAPKNKGVLLHNHCIISKIRNLTLILYFVQMLPIIPITSFIEKGLIFHDLDIFYEYRVAIVKNILSIWVCWMFSFLCVFCFKFLLAAWGLHCCAWTFFSCSEQGLLLLVVVCGLIIAVASLVTEHRLQARRLQQLWHTGSRAQAQ